MSVIIRLQGLPLSAASGDIRNFFSGLRIPDGAVNIVGGDDGDAFIGFATDEDARQAMRKNNGHIHNAEVRLFLSSRSERAAAISTIAAANAASGTAPLSANPPSIPPRFGCIMPPRFEKEETARFPHREDSSRFGRDVPPYGRNGPPFGREETSKYIRDEPPPASGNGRFPCTPHGGLAPGTKSAFGIDSRFSDRKEEREGGGQRPHMDRPPFDVQRSNYGNEKIDQSKNDEDGMGVRNVPWMNRERDSMVHQNGGRGYTQNPSLFRQPDGDRRAPIPSRELDPSIFGNSRSEGDKGTTGGSKEESWRCENNKPFERMPPRLSQKEDEVSFFGRVPKRALIPPPMVSLPSSIPPLSSHPSTVHTQKEEVFVELTRLPPDLLRPSILEEFLSPSTPLTLSSVKVVYSPEGIHLHSLVRFTSAMDAFNALKKDGEQGVKIRPSTKEAFDMARDGPPPTLSHLPPSLPPPLPPFPLAPPMGGMPPSAVPRLNLFTMPLIDPNGIVIGNERRGINGGRDGMDDGRGERRREDSPPRGRREERRRRSNSPRPKKLRTDRVCVQVSNLPFRVKEPEIRRMLGPGLNPYAIKKIFNEDNAPSDVWIMEFSTEPEAIETVNRRMEMGGRQARLKIIDEPEADRLLRQKFRSPPRRKNDSFDEKVRMQQEAIEMEKSRMHGSGELSRGEKPLAGAFSAPVFTTNRGFMRGGRGRGRGRGGGVITAMGRPGERNCLLVSNMPPLPAPQILLEHLRIIPSQFVRIDQIAPDAAIIELRGEKDAMGAAEMASGSPLLNGRRLIVAAMARRQIEEELNLRVGERDNDHTKHEGSHRIDPEMVRSLGDAGCVIGCEGFPRDLAIDEVKCFFDGYPVIESSVRMRVEAGEGTGECMLALRDNHSARRAVQSLNGRLFRGAPVSLSLLS